LEWNLRNLLPKTEKCIANFKLKMTEEWLQCFKTYTIIIIFDYVSSLLKHSYVQSSC
jgi:hypothetical protein